LAKYDQQKKKKQKKGSGFAKLKLFIIIGVLAYAGITFVSQQSTLSTQLKRQEELQAKEEELQREIDFLENELNFIGSDEYIEQQARIRLGWLNPDEVKYVEGENGAVVQESQTSGQPGDPPSGAEEPETSADPSGQPENEANPSPEGENNAG
jgi:cell division protein FtsB